MTKKEYEKIKVRLNRYRELRGKVGRLAEEAARWNAMAELSASELRRPGRGGGGHQDMGALKSSAMAIEEERHNCHNHKSDSANEYNSIEHLIQIITGWFSRSDTWYKSTLFLHIICNL